MKADRIRSLVEAVIKILKHQLQYRDYTDSVVKSAANSPAIRSNTARLVTAVASLLVAGYAPAVHAQAFVHPGLLNVQSDFDRMKTQVAAGSHPWIDSYNILAANSHTSLSWTPSPAATVIRGSTNGSDNYGQLYNDIAAAYQDTLMWKITGNTAYADKAVQICNAWSGTLTAITSAGSGSSDFIIAAGIYGYEFANVAENLRGYNGWTSANLTQFRNMMLDVFYPISHTFLTTHQGACIDAYYGSWDELSYANVLAIGVLCDDRAKYNEAITYFKTGAGAGSIDNSVYQLWPGLLGQLQESGRDQGHSGLTIGLLGATCQMAWNQGDDLFGYENNKFLSGAEYFARYNLGNSVPFAIYDNCQNFVQPVVSADARGDLRPIWGLIYNHYANMLGLACPYTKQYVALVGNEGGGGNYGPNSGGYDQLGYTTLTCGLPASTANPFPTGVTAAVIGPAVTVSWWGSATATSYNVARSTVSGGPYTTIASNVTANTYTDSMAVPGIIYYYVVQSVAPGGTSGYSAQISATPNTQLTGTVIGTSGSIGNDGNTIANAFDGCLRSYANYVDGPDASGDWLGLDFGSGYSYVVNQVKYCPRSGWASRMIGGVIQGSNTADFSSGVTTLYTINSAPADNGTFTTATFSNTTPFRYVRYVGPNNGYCNITEIQFYGYTAANGTYKIINRNSGKAMDVAGAGTANGTQIDQWPYNNLGNDKWTLTSLGNGQFEIVGVGSGKCLDVSGGSTADGTKVQIWTYGNYANEHYALIPAGSGYFRIAPAHSDKAIEVVGNSTANGALVDQWSWNGGNNQQWSLGTP